MRGTFAVAWLLTFAVAPLLCACSSSTSAALPPPSPGFTPLPVLVPGSLFRYAGRFSETITYASPSPQQPNSTGTYTTQDVQRVSAAPAGAPDPFEVRREIRYTVTGAPTSGIELQARTIDTFESSTVTKTSQTIAESQTATTTTGVDQTANRVEGNGPYAYASTITTTYPAPHVLLVFPLVRGSRDEPLARTAKTVESSVNKSGDVYLSQDTTTHYNNAGAYAETGLIGPGENTDARTHPNGTGALLNTGPTQLRLTIGLPAKNASGAFEIPVTRTSQGVTESYLAADWYPGAAAPPSPLAATEQRVKGPATIPLSCAVKVAVSDVQEVDSSSTSVDVLTGKYTLGKTRDFLSNGTTLCRITSTTTLAYGIETGSLFSTTVDVFTEGLTAESIP
jgi:hypothetical protein